MDTSGIVFILFGAGDVKILQHISFSRISSNESPTEFNLQQELIDLPPADTPLMRQFRQIKEKNPNALLLFRMGDFYETFEDDARIASEVLGITLTKRANGQARNVALAGFPHHALDTYLPRLVQAGYRVAICEQLEDPKKTKQIVKRGVVEVVTPGVSFRHQLLQPNRANYLASIFWSQDNVGVAFVDASTGEFTVGEVATANLGALVNTIGAAELIVSKRQRDDLGPIAIGPATVTPLDEWVYGYDFAYETLVRHFGTHSLKGFGIEDFQAGIVAAGAAIHYLSETQRGGLPHIRKLRRYDASSYMMLDQQTMRNLELTASMQGGNREGSLISILDETLTAMGGRLLRNWLVRPLLDVAAINSRLMAVDEFKSSRRFRDRVRDELRKVGDLERVVTRICMGRAGPRDLSGLRSSLEQVDPLKEALVNAESELLAGIRGRLDNCPEVVEQISTAISDAPPAVLSHGGVIRTGFSAELDELRDLASSGRQWIARLQAEEAQKSGIPSLKVGYNKVFGYYIEITNAHRDKVPESYIRKQTLVNAERYITPELKTYEERILTADEKIAQLEQTLFQELMALVSDHADRLQSNARLLAKLDVLACFAHVSERDGLTRPEVHEGTGLNIVDGRHPVVESLLPAGEPFIPNSVCLDPEHNQILVITGPNMAGKSVVLRQTGLIVLLAQIGAHVPAKEAQIGLVDRIFTRVGAHDNLSSGESTFLVEMNETANILNNATPRSLILFDEVGRGTSTFDGISIAWAILEFLHEHAEVAARTLFATHYHELNMLADRLERITNARIQVQEHDGKIVFLRNLVPGAADHSYGIEVARMAGLPAPVIDRARALMQLLEEEKFVDGDQILERAGPPDFHDTTDTSDTVNQEVLDTIRALDLETTTPIEALTKLAELRERLQP